ncbi:MAG: PD40 domain-containing protein, partial [Anaerolineae bacterium]|nr:PD40 domain-containing protein [Anaerolineae bacterium]
AVMQLDGTDGKIIWHVEDEKIAGPPQWSPDSQRVVFAAVSPQEREIQVISLEGKEVTHIAGMTGGFEQERSDTAFDPSGRNVVYYDSDYPSWMIADAEGEEDAEPIDIEALPALWTGAYYPQWGNEELLARSEPLTGEPAGSGFPGEPVRVAPCDWDGSGSGLCIYSLVEERAPARILEDAGFEHIDGVSWSPEGQQLVLAGTRPDAGSDVGNALFVVNVNGSGLIQITHSGNSVNPSWGPDGEWIVFHYNCDLGRIHSDGSDLQVIWQGQGRCVFSPQWSPGGEQIVFSAIPNGEWQFPLEREVIVIGRDGTDPRSIVMTAHDSEAHFGHEVAFSPDQSHIAYLDGENRARIVYLENGETERVQDFPYGWMSTQHPQWGHD